MIFYLYFLILHCDHPLDNEILRVGNYDQVPKLWHNSHMHTTAQGPGTSLYITKYPLNLKEVRALYKTGMFGD